MTEQKAVAGVAVREDDERIGRALGVGFGGANSASYERGRGAVSRRGSVLAPRLSARQRGGIPNLHGERAVIARNRLAGCRVHDVEFVLVDEVQGAHADFKGSVRRKLGRVLSDEVDAVVRVADARLLGGWLGRLGKRATPEEEHEDKAR